MKSFFFFSGPPSDFKSINFSTHGVLRSLEETTTAPSTDILTVPKVTNRLMLYSNFPLNAVQQDAKGGKGKFVDKFTFSLGLWTN